VWLIVIPSEPLFQTAQTVKVLLKLSTTELPEFIQEIKKCVVDLKDNKLSQEKKEINIESASCYNTLIDNQIKLCLESHDETEKYVFNSFKEIYMFFIKIEGCFVACLYENQCRKEIISNAIKLFFNLYLQEGEDIAGQYIQSWSNQIDKNCFLQLNCAKTENEVTFCMLHYDLLEGGYMLKDLLQLLLRLTIAPETTT
jgi:hypothetical protein